MKMRFFFFVLCLIGFGPGTVTADTDLQQKFIESSIEPQEFIEKASAASMAEVRLGKMALEKSTLKEVRHFAQMMIEGHTVMNQQLRELADSMGIVMADEPTLLKKAKAYVMSQREGESFDESYAQAQVATHEKTYKLFRQAVNSSDDRIKEFAEAKLRTMEHHLNMARVLATTVAQTNATDGNPKGIYTP